MCCLSEEILQRRSRKSQQYFRFFEGKAGRVSQKDEVLSSFRHRVDNYLEGNIAA